MPLANFFLAKATSLSERQTNLTLLTSKSKTGAGGAEGKAAEEQTSKAQKREEPESPRLETPTLDRSVGLLIANQLASLDLALLAILFRDLASLDRCVDLGLDLAVFFDGGIKAGARA